MGEFFRMSRGVFPNVSKFCDPASLALHVMAFAPATDAEALKLLRASFPDSPLSLRVAALDFLMRRGRADGGRLHSPK